MTFRRLPPRPLGRDPEPSFSAALFPSQTSTARGRERTAAIQEELNAVRGELEEVLERQYTMERMLAAGNAMVPTLTSRVGNR
jgi:hypothetical protein